MELTESDIEKIAELFKIEIEKKFPENENEVVISDDSQSYCGNTNNVTLKMGEFEIKISLVSDCIYLKKENDMTWMRLLSIDLGVKRLTFSNNKVCDMFFDISLAVNHKIFNEWLERTGRKEDEKDEIKFNQTLKAFGIR